MFAKKLIKKVPGLRLVVLSSYKLFLLSSHFHPKKYFANKTEKTVVIICLWRRFDRINDILQQLDAQHVRKGSIDVFFWNNNHARRAYLRKKIENYRLSGAINSVSVFNSLFNIGGFGRFYAARKLRKLHKRVVFLDDDQIVAASFVEECDRVYREKQMASFWAFKINGEDYWDRTKVGYGEDGDYCGTGGMIIDSSIFDDINLFGCPEKYWFIEDLWLSHYAKQKQWKLTGLDTKIEFVSPELDQGHVLVDKKREFYKYLLDKATV